MMQPSKNWPVHDSMVTRKKMRAQFGCRKSCVRYAQTQTGMGSTLLWRLEAERPKLKAEGADEKNDNEVQDEPDGVLKVLGTASLDLRGNIESVVGQHEHVIKLLKLAEDKEKDLRYRDPPSYSRPESESLGYVYQRAHEWQNARDAFNQDLRERRPKTGFALHGIAQSYALAGQIKEANDAYKRFLEGWAHADGVLPQVQQAKAWLTHTASKWTYGGFPGTARTSREYAPQLRLSATDVA